MAFIDWAKMLLRAAESAVPEAVPGPGDGAALQHAAVLQRLGRVLYSGVPGGLAGGLNTYGYMGDPLGLAKCNAPNVYKNGDVDPHGQLSPGVNRAIEHTNSRADGFVLSHHLIQDAWAKKRINDYQRNSAPATLLKSSSGSPHAAISCFATCTTSTKRLMGYNNKAGV